jgi:hypothetical protein
MANLSVTDFKAFINKQIELQERMEENLHKIEAQIDIALLSDNFYGFTRNTLHSYFLAVADILSRVIQANQASLHELFSVQRTPSLIEARQEIDC